MRYNGSSEFQGSFVWIYYGQECNVRNEIRFWLRDDLREMLPQNKEEEDDQEKDTKRRGSSVRVLIPEEKQEREEKRSGHKKNKRGVSQRQRSSSWSHEHEIWGKRKREREKEMNSREKSVYEETVKKTQKTKTEAFGDRREEKRGSQQQKRKKNESTEIESSFPLKHCLFVLC